MLLAGRDMSGCRRYLARLKSLLLGLALAGSCSRVAAAGCRFEEEAGTQIGRFGSSVRGVGARVTVLGWEEQKVTDLESGVSIHREWQRWLSISYVLVD